MERAQVIWGQAAIDDLSFNLPPAAIVGVIGPNGAGKTTLMRMIGDEYPTEETRSASSSALRIRSVATLDGQTTRASATSAARDRSVASRAYVAASISRASDQQKKAEAVRGERNRLQRKPAGQRRHLILDEPTTTCRACRGGAAGLPARRSHLHDRWFCRCRIATVVLGDSCAGLKWHPRRFPGYECFAEADCGNDAWGESFAWAERRCCASPQAATAGSQCGRSGSCPS